MAWGVSGHAHGVNGEGWAPGLALPVTPAR